MATQEFLISPTANNHVFGSCGITVQKMTGLTCVPAFNTKPLNLISGSLSSPTTSVYASGNFIIDLDISFVKDIYCITITDENGHKSTGYLKNIARMKLTRNFYHHSTEGYMLSNLHVVKTGAKHFTLEVKAEPLYPIPKLLTFSSINGFKGFIVNEHQVIIGYCRINDVNNNVSGKHKKDNILCCLNGTLSNPNNLDNFDPNDLTSIPSSQINENFKILSIPKLCSGWTIKNKSTNHKSKSPVLTLSFLEGMKHTEVLNTFQIIVPKELTNYRINKIFSDIITSITFAISTFINSNGQVQLFQLPIHGSGASKISPYSKIINITPNKKVDQEIVVTGDKEDASVIVLTNPPSSSFFGKLRRSLHLTPTVEKVEVVEMDNEGTKKSDNIIDVQTNDTEENIGANPSLIKATAKPESHNSIVREFDHLKDAALEKHTISSTATFPSTNEMKSSLKKAFTKKKKSSSSPTSSAALVPIPIHHLSDNQNHGTMVPNETFIISAGITGLCVFIFFIWYLIRRFSSSSLSLINNKKNKNK